MGELSLGYLNLLFAINNLYIVSISYLFEYHWVGLIKITALLQLRRIRSRGKYLRALLQLCCLLLYSCSLPCQCCCSQVGDLLGLLLAQHSAAPACESEPGSVGGTCQGSLWGPWIQASKTNAAFDPFWGFQRVDVLKSSHPLALLRSSIRSPDCCCRSSEFLQKKVKRCQDVKICC